MREPLFHSVRARLTAWYVIVAAVFLGAFGIVTDVLLERTLQQRTDASLHLAADSFAHAVAVELEESQKTLEQLIIEESLELPIPDRAIAVFREDGSVVTASPSQRTRAMQLHVERLRRAAQWFTTLDRDTDEALRLFTTRLTLGGVPLRIVVARRLRDQTELLRTVRDAFLIGIPLCVACAGFLGWWIVGKALDPVVAMSLEAATISAADLTRRLPVHDPRDELGRLALTFNELLDRLTATLERQRRFMADASHELRTPVAVVRSEADVALSQSRTEEALRESLGVIQQESALLSSIIDDLFLLARADTGHAVLTPHGFYLDELLAEAVHSFRSMAAQKSIELTTALLPDSEITADERLIRRLIVNLLDNAVKYTAAGGRVAVELTRERSAYAIRIADSGTPIAPGQSERIFDRFDRGHAVDADGAGLGLPIARSIAALHGGRVELQVRADGNTFAIYLPFTFVRA